MRTADIKTYAFKSGLSHQIEVVDLATLTHYNKEILRPHRTDFYHVFLFGRCSPTHLVDFRPVRIVPNSLLFIDRHRVHRFDDRRPYDGKVIIFTDEFFCTDDSATRFLRTSLLFNDLVDMPAVAVGKRMATFAQVAQWIEDECSSPDDPPKHGILRNHMHNLLLMAGREKQSRIPTPVRQSAELDFTLAFRDRLEQCFASVKLVGAYAKHLNISEKRLHQATKTILGKSPKNLIDERVLLEAKRLLVHGHLSVKEIGFYLGFDEPTNFIKYFRKRTRLTPGEFRAKNLR